MTCSSRIMIEILPESHSVEKFDFLKSISHSQIIQLSVMLLASFGQFTLLQ